MNVPLEEAAGLCAVSDMIAPHPLPRFANSSMDGYAVRRTDVEGSVALSVVGEIRAGDPAERTLGPGEAMRIMTGAPLPPGADVVLPIEVVSENQGMLEVHEVPGTSYVRPAGDDIEAGAVAVEAGRPLGPGELALLAALGAEPIEVRRVPHVAVVTSGDELVAPAHEPGPGQIRDSNAVALSTLVGEANASVVLFARVPDDPDAVTGALQSAAASADLVLSAGGVSVGRHDYVREVVERDGEVALWRVAVQPGKPLLAGRVYGTPFIGLPGNPVSVHVGFEQFVRPALRKMLGCKDLQRPLIRAVLAERITKPPGRLHLVRVTLTFDAGRIVATPTGPQGSHIQTSLVGCDGLMRFPADLTELEAGAEVELEVWRLPSVL
jgi:molybdopterin molybdotransferase